MRFTAGLILLLLLVGCHRGALSQAPPVTNPAPPPLTDPKELATVPSAESVRWAPPPPAKPGFYLVAVAPETGETEALLERTNGDFAVAASPDGRYLLILTEVQEDPPYGASGRWTILDRSTGKVTEGPQGAYQRVFGWSGRGFWLDPLTHMDLRGQIDHHEALAQLAKDAQIVGVAWQADGSHVAMVIKPGNRERADLLWATEEGRVLGRADGVVQPFWGKQGTWMELALSPDGKRLYLRAPYPGTALIDTEALAFEQWRSLNGKWQQGAAEGGGAPSTLWSPDGRFLLEGARRLFDREGQPLWSRDAICMATWLPDSTGLLCTSEWANDRFGTARRVRLDGQSERLSYAIGGQVLSWLPDGRLLVSLLSH